MKKIITFFLLIMFLFNITILNNVNAYSKNKITKQDIVYYNKLLEKQDKDCLQTELKIQKLQKTLVKNVRDILENYKKLENNLNQYKNNFHEEKDYELKSNLDIDLDVYNTFVGKIKYKTNKDKLFHLSTNINELLLNDNFIKNKTFQQGNNNGILSLSYLDNYDLNLKYDIDNILYNNQLFLEIKKIIVSSSFKNLLSKKEDLNTFNKILGLEENKGIELIKQIEYTKNNINKAGIKFHKKTLLINNGKLNKQNYLKNLLSNEENILSKLLLNLDLKKSDNKIIDKDYLKKIEKVLDILDKEKLVHVYEYNKRYRYYKFYFDTELAIKINKTLGFNLIPIVNYEVYKKTWDEYGINRFYLLNDGSFKYLFITKTKDKKIGNIIYFLFDEAGISLSVLKTKNLILFSNRNIIKFKTRQYNGYISFLNNEFKLKLLNKRNGIGSLYNEILYFYLSENIDKGLIQLDYINSKTKQKLGLIKGAFIKDKFKNYKYYGNINISGQLLKLKKEEEKNKIDEVNLKNSTKITNKKENNRVLTTGYNTAIISNKLKLDPFYKNINYSGMIDLDFNLLKLNNNKRLLINVNNTGLLPFNIQGYIKYNLEKSYKKVKVKKPKRYDYKFSSMEDFLNLFLKKR